VASGGHNEDGAVRLWDAKDLTRIAVLKGSNSVQVVSLAFAPDGRTLAYGNWLGSVRLWQLAGDSPKTLAEIERDSKVAFSTDGKLVVTWGSPWGGKEGDYPGITLWNVTPKGPVQKTRIEGHKAHVGAVAISPDNKLLAIGYDNGTCRLLDLTDAHSRELASLGGEDDRPVVTLAFAAQGKTLFIGEGTAVWRQRHAKGLFPRNVRRWDLTQKPFREKAPLTGLYGWVSPLEFVPDRSMLAGHDQNGTFCCWDLSGQEPKLAYKQCHAFNTFAFSKDGKTLVTGDSEGAIRLWNFDGGKLSARDAERLPHDK
jgi:WD40 repeat protein